MDSSARCNDAGCSSKSRGLQKANRHTEIGAVYEIEQVDAKVQTVTPDAKPLDDGQIKLNYVSGPEAISPNASVLAELSEKVKWVRCGETQRLRTSQIKCAREGHEGITKSAKDGLFLFTTRSAALFALLVKAFS